MTAPFVLGGSGGLRLRMAHRWNAAALRTWFAIGLVVAVIGAPLRGLYHTTGGTMEEGFMLVFPESLLKGKLPNKDFLHLYGPGSIDVLAGWYWLFGVRLEAERTFGLMQHLAIIFALFTLARPWGRWTAAAVAGLATFYVLTPIGLTAMAWNGGLALALWSLVLAIRAHHLPSRSRVVRCLVGSGVLAGLALSYRPDLVVALGIGVVWLVWRNDWWKRFAVGVVIGLLPTLVHVVLVGPGTAFAGMFTDPVLRLRGGRHLPIPPSWDRLDGSLQAIAETVPPWWKVPHLSAEHSLFVWFFAMFVAAFAMAWLGFRWFRRRGDMHSRVILGVGLFSVGLLPQALQRPDSTHLAWVTCVSFPFLIVVFVDILRRRRVPARPAIATAAAMATVLTLIAAPLFTFRYYLLHVRVAAGNVQTPFPVARDGRRFYLGDYPPYLATQGVIDDLGALSVPGERLFVGPGDLRRTFYADDFFYYLFPELTPATYFIEMDPGLANAPGSRMAADLRTADWVVLTHFWDGWREPNTSADFGDPASNEIIATEFCLIQSYIPINGVHLVELYERCDRPGVAIHRAAAESRAVAVPPPPEEQPPTPGPQQGVP